MTHKKNIIKEFLLSLAGKGWLWGTGKVITVNPEYAHLLQEQSNYNVSPSPFERQFKTKEGLPEMEVLREESLHITEENDNKNKEYLTEIDFMCAWLDLFLELPEKSKIQVDDDGIMVYANTHCDYFWLRLNTAYEDTRPDKAIICKFINQHGIENLEWMFKSVTYDA